MVPDYMRRQPTKQRVLGVGFGNLRTWFGEEEPLPPERPVRKVSLERLRRAFRGGVQARMRLSGRNQSRAPMPKLAEGLADQCWVVLRGKYDDSPGFYSCWHVGQYRLAQPEVEDPQGRRGLLETGVFQGFPTFAEGLEYARGALCEVPDRRYEPPWLFRAIV